MSERQIITPFGHFVLHQERDAKMATRLEGREYPQQELLDLVSALRARRVVDVGARIGTVSVPLARQGVQVMAFEPNQESFTYLVRNVEQNGVTIDARHKGVSDQAGRAESVAQQAANAGAHLLRPGDSVEVSTLDREVVDADIIKIDVEGMELHVLSGARELITRSRPAVYFEVNLSALRGYHTTLAALTQFFIRRQYTLYFLENRTLYTLPNLTFAAWFIAPRSLLFRTRSAPFDILALPNETHSPYPVRTYLGTTVHLLVRYVRLHYARFSH